MTFVTDLMSSPRGRSRLIPALLLGAAVAGAWLWWRGRPERHLAEAGRLLGAGAWDEAGGWVDLPEATPATRERALILR
ncbi:MAG: hypothetical protein LC745_05470, partial [Planctomycetia bacterium]|nr:hypothetical protein [Planctomycetia bacterium]